MTHLSESHVSQPAVLVLTEASFDGLAKALELSFNEFARHASQGATGTMVHSTGCKTL